MNMEPENILKALNLFVGKDELRPWMLDPFKDGNYYAATDGYTLMAVPVSEAALPLQDTDKSRVGNLLNFGRDTNPVLLSIPFLRSSLEIKNVPELDENECDVCKGEGDIYCNSCRHSHKCESCRGNGYFTYKTGKSIESCRGERYRLLSNVFNGEFILRLIQACEILSITEIYKVSVHIEKGAVIFQGGNILFLIMPIADASDSIVKQINLPELVNEP